MKSGFTMMELIFVIVIIGILSGVAITKINFGRNDAEIANARVQLASVKAAIMTTYNDKLLSGSPGYPSTLEASPDNQKYLFEGVLPMSGIKVSSGKNGWKKSGDSYTYTNSGNTAIFTYSSANGTLTCSGSLCSSLE